MKIRLLLLVAIVAHFSSFSQNNEKNVAIQLVKKNKNIIGLTGEDIANSIVSDSYFNKTAGTQMVYLQQSYLTLPVYNVLMVLAFKKDSLASKSGGRIKNIHTLTNSQNGIPSINAQMAVMTALADRKVSATNQPIVLGSQFNGNKIIFNDMGISRENITAELMWVPVDEGKKVVLCWQIYFIPKTTSDYWMIRVNAMDNTIAGINNLTVYCNWGSHSNSKECKHHDAVVQEENVSSVASSAPTSIDNASYKVIPYPAESPIHPGGTPTVVTNPWEAAAGNATSLKWHSTGATDYTNTRGNNVWAAEDRKGSNSGGNTANSTTTAEPLKFEFTPNFLLSPTQIAPNPNQPFSITNLFYWNNVIHDISYLHGFDEASGNFQANNQGRGGAGNDPVLADAQDGSGNNNANFATPPDGGSPRMQMYLWNGAPQKDGSVDNGIIAHEFAHGISTRLTGGPSQVGCISNDESMSEGWSDYYGIMFTQDWAGSNVNSGFNTPRTIGTYAIGQTPDGNGLRSKKYCTNFAVNDKVYSTTIESQVHARGELWCTTLWDMTWNIINQTGKISPNLYDVNGGGGNTIALKLVTEGMKLQPCFPGFIDGRDAILKADEIIYGGAYSCAIKEAFRRRGMGAYASQGSSTSVSDQTADFSSGDARLSLSQNITKVPEGENITYTNTVSAGNCSGISNFVLTDTLPTNVTYISGGTYNPANRVVSFPVNIGAGQTANYTFTVKVNEGTYFPTTNLFEDSVTQTDFPNKWIASPTTGKFWSVSKKRSFSPERSYYSSDPVNESNIQLTLKNPLALGANPPKLTFRHWYNTEYTYDGGVLEISTDGGISWKDMQNDILEGKYTASMDASTTLARRKAWTGNSNNNFIKSVVDLTPYANQNVLLRFRFTSDLGTNLEGWYIDEIRIKDEALVEIKSNLFNSNSKKILTADTTTSILPKTTCVAAAITTQPKNIKACSGGSATLDVISAGSSPVYRWQISKDNGITYNDMPGENNSTLTFNSIAAGDNLNLYRVIIENACPSSVISNAALLTVSDAVSITGQPDNRTVCSGENTSFSITTSSVPSSYTWQVSKDGGSTFSDLPNENTSTIVLNNVSSLLNGEQLRVKVSSCGPDDVISAVATLTVNSAPEIISQPADANACIGNSITINATINGTALSFQWQESKDGGATYTDIPNEISSSLTLTNLSASMNNYRYRVIASGSACPGTVTSNAAVLSVSNNTSIISQPSNTSTCAGSTALFNVNATGTGLNYQWQVSTDGGTNYADVVNEKNASLNLNDVKITSNNTLFRVIIGSACSATQLISSSATLTVYPLAQITEQPKNAGVCVNGSVNFTAAASGNSIAYQWQMSTDDGDTFTDIPNSTGNTLIISNASLSLNNNRYRLQASGAPCGSAVSDAAILSVSSPGVIVEQPKNISVCDKTEAKFSVAATGTSISYQWQLSSNNGNSFSDIANAKTNTLTIASATSTQNKNLYRVAIKENNCGTILSDPALLNVNALPSVSINAIPASAVLPGQTITLTASSSPFVNIYKWYLNGSLISNQTEKNIIVGADKLGTYTLTVTDANGCINSSPAINVKDSILNTALIYPNPNDGKFQIREGSYATDNKGRKVKIFDSKGAVVYSKEFTVNFSYQPMEIVAEKLSDGLYLLTLYDSRGKLLKSEKLLIIR